MEILDILYDAITDSFKLVPLLFISYFVLEYIESRNKIDVKKLLKKYGPLIGSLFGVIPQCGFSILATTLFISKEISLGTLISVYISTSDEAIPLFLSNYSNMNELITLLLLKLLIAITSGYIIDFIFHLNYEASDIKIEKCDCNFFKSAIKRTFNILKLVLIANVLISILIFFIGNDTLKDILSTNSYLQPIISSIIGLVPNCAISVMLCEFYFKGCLNFGALLSGLISNAGVGIIILFKQKNKKLILVILSILVLISSISGILYTFI